MAVRSPDTSEKRAAIDSAESLDSIEKLMENLSASTEKLSVSSDRLENLTEILIILTFFLSFVEVISIVFPNPAPDSYIRLVVGVLFIIILIIAFFYRKRPKRIFQKVQKSLFK